VDLRRKVLDLRGEPRYMIKTYSANFTITSAMASCSPFEQLGSQGLLPGSIDCSVEEKPECKCGSRPGYIDPSLCTASCNFLNAPVVEKFHESDDFKKLYWNLDTSPTKGPKEDICGMGIRNCINAVDWTEIESK
jgi:hypothetical protein